MEGDTGFEPVVNESKSNVLPITLIPYGASDRIRTYDFLTPNQADYQTVLHSL